MISRKIWVEENFINFHTVCEARSSYDSNVEMMLQVDVHAFEWLLFKIHLENCIWLPNSISTALQTQIVLGILKNCLILMRMSIWSEILWQVKKWGRFFKSTLGGFSHDLKTCLKSSGSDLFKKKLKRS